MLLLRMVAFFQKALLFLLLLFYIVICHIYVGVCLLRLLYVSDLYSNDLVEMYIKQDITEFTEANKVGHILLSNFIIVNVVGFFNE